MRELIRSCRRARRHDAVAAAMLDGLTGAGPLWLERRPEESTPCFAARLNGRFLAWVESTGRPLEDALVMSAAPYLTTVAARIAEGGWDPDSRDPQEVLRMHTGAMVYLERRLGAPTPVEHENLLVSWLAAQARMRPTDASGSRLGGLRRRRLERAFGPGEE